jgi:hypothetical protein
LGFGKRHEEGTKKNCTPVYKSSYLLCLLSPSTAGALLLRVIDVIVVPEPPPPARAVEEDDEDEDDDEEGGGGGPLPLPGLSGLAVADRNRSVHWNQLVRKLRDSLRTFST